MSCILFEAGDGAPVILCVGGPSRTIEVDGVTYQYEMHPYHGPCPENKNGTARMTNWPRKVWDAVCELEKLADELQKANPEVRPETPS